MPHEIIREMNIENVLRQSVELFAKHGVERTTIAMIAKASGVSMRSVMNYFATKDDLVRGALHLMLKESYERFWFFCGSQEHQSKNGLNQVLGVARYLLEEAEGRHTYINSMTEMEMHLCRSGWEGADKYCADALYQVEQPLRTALLKGVADGSIRKVMEKYPDMAGTISLSLRGMYRQLAFLCENPSPRTEYRPDKVFEDYMRMLEKSIGSPEANTN